MRDELASRAIEQKVLSYLFEYEQEQHGYMPKLNESDFHYFGQTFELFQKLYNSEDQKLDSATVYTRGDESKINDILRTSVSPSEIDSLYDNLKDLSHRRKLLYFTKMVDGAIQSDETIKEKIIDSYNRYNYPFPSNIYEFFKNKNWRDYIEEFTKWENKIMELYKNENYKIK